MTLRSWVRSPLFWILAVAGAVRLAGIAWGLPAADGWDDDGFAPRNFLTALALTYKPGSFFTYPPLHAFLLAVLTLPGSILALVHARSFAQADVIAAFTKVPIMTFFAVVARLVSMAMSLGIIYGVGRMAETIWGRRAGLFAAAACALNVALTYYSQVTNLDVAYLFWSTLSLLGFMRAIAEREPSRFSWAFLFAAAAVATKDQAYAVFLLSVPAALLLWFAADPWARAHWRRVVPALLLWAAVALGLLLLIDGAITNPGGFTKRIAFLAGPASRNYAVYRDGVGGRLGLSADMWGYFTHGYGAVGVFLALLGLAVHVRRFRGDKAMWAAGMLPFLAAVSFTVGFNFVALRADDRFLLPQGILAAVYIGVAVERLAFLARPRARWAARALLAATALFAFYHCTAVDAAFILDPRYDAERWMNAHVRPGDTIETYGQNAYLPRFPGRAVVSRVGEGPLDVRNPLPHVTEFKQPFSEVARRNPKFIVISAWWVQHYLNPDCEPGGGRANSEIQRAQFRDDDARRYFARLNAGDGGYRLVHASRYKGTFWPSVHIHESLDETIRIFERRDAR